MIEYDIGERARYILVTPKFLAKGFQPLNPKEQGRSLKCSLQVAFLS